MTRKERKLLAEQVNISPREIKRGEQFWEKSVAFQRIKLGLAVEELKKAIIDSLPKFIKRLLK